MKKKILLSLLLIQAVVFIGRVVFVMRDDVACREDLDRQARQLQEYNRIQRDTATRAALHNSDPAGHPTSPHRALGSFLTRPAPERIALPKEW